MFTLKWFNCANSCLFFQEHVSMLCAFLNNCLEKLWEILEKLWNILKFKKYKFSIYYSNNILFSKISIFFRKFNKISIYFKTTINFIQICCIFHENGLRKIGNFKWIFIVHFSMWFELIFWKRVPYGLIAHIAKNIDYTMRKIVLNLVNPFLVWSISKSKKIY